MFNLKPKGHKNSATLTFSNLFRRKITASVLMILLFFTFSTSPIMAVDCSFKVAGEFEAPVDSLSNDYLRIDLNACGQFVIGTTQGDPDITSDDEKRLMYGYEPNGQSSIWSSYTTVQLSEWDDIQGPVGPRFYHALNYINPISNGCTDSICTTVWHNGGGIAEIIQTLTFMENPYSGRDDMVKIQYNVSNLSSGGDIRPIGAGVRIMLDTMVGNNDSALFLLPGFNPSSNQQEYLADDIPDYFLAFESSTFASDSLKSTGLLNEDLINYCESLPDNCNDPNRVVVANWFQVFQNDVVAIPESPEWWDYTVDPNQAHGDSALLVYWDVERIGVLNGQVFQMAYGLAGEGGDEYWTTAPTRIEVTDIAIEAVSWINNTTDATFTNGTASINLPPGLEVDTDEITLTANSIAQVTTTQPVGDVLPGELRQVSWPIRITGGAGTYNYSTEVTFDTGQTFTTQNQLIVEDSSSVYLPLIIK